MNSINKTAVLFFCLAFIGLLGFYVIQAEAADEPPTELYVRTTPQGAKILLDGKELGVSPGLFPIKPGEYKIIIDLEGYQPAGQQINVRDGRITRIELTLKPRAKSDKSEKDPLDAAKAEPDPNVVEGVGWGAFQVGATREELVKALGQPETNPNPQNPWVWWRSKYHIDCLIDEQRGAFEIRFNEGFNLPLTSGVKIGSPENDVLSAYGSPTRVVNKPQSKMLEYGNRGVLMWIADGKVYDFTVFKAHEMGEQQSAQTPSTNNLAANISDSKVVEGVGWRAFRVGATSEELLKAVGMPENNPNPQNPWVHWTSRYHIDCLFNESHSATAIQFTEGFELPLTSGIKIGSPEKDVIAAYGKPELVVDKGPAKQFRYLSRGVFLYVMNGKVSSFMVVDVLKSEAQSSNILKNPGFESGDKAPDHWEKGAVPKGAKIDGVKYSWDKKVASEGKASLCIEKTAQRYFPIAQWSQTVDREGDKPVLLVTAQVKTKNMTKAVLDVLFLDAQDNWISHQWIAYIGAKEEGDPPANHDWKEYSGKADIPPNTAKICIGLQDYGPGKVWFDDVRADYIDTVLVPKDGNDTQSQQATTSESLPLQQGREDSSASKTDSEKINSDKPDSNKTDPESETVELLKKAQAKMDASSPLDKAQKDWSDALQTSDQDMLAKNAAAEWRAANNIAAKAKSQADAGKTESAASLYADALVSLNKANEISLIKQNAKAKPIIQKLEAALKRKDKAAAESLLAEIEKIIPDDERLFDLRNSVESLTGLRKNITIPLGKGVNMELVLIQPGSFMMGEAGTTAWESPVHKVNITKPFWMGKFEVTQEQWQAIMENNPSSFKGPKNPVENISWEDCQEFLKKINEKFNRSGLKFSLPTEAQWEYACRAGSTTRYFFGDADSNLAEYAWENSNSEKNTHQVGQKRPNAWGLYDMLGNVLELCADRLDGGYYAVSPPDDPAGPSAGYSPVVRGGCWKDDNVLNFRSANRVGAPTFTTRVNWMGLRVVAMSQSKKETQFKPEEQKEQKDVELMKSLEKAQTETVAPSPLDKSRKDWAAALEASDQDMLAKNASAEWRAANNIAAKAKSQADAGKTESAASLYADALASLNKANEISLTKQNAKVKPIIQRLEAAIKRKDQTASELLLAEIEKINPKDERIINLRKSVESLTGLKQNITLDLGNSANMELVLIKPGSFIMGDANGEDREKPAHKVNITKSFWIGKYEVTREQWQAIMGNNPNSLKAPKNPMESVSWEDCQDFIKKINEKFKSSGLNFNLPTEAQWEYACRAGTENHYSFGDNETDLGDYAWFGFDPDFGGMTHKVGQKRANPWGIYDMHGNVWEWCSDWFDAGYYNQSPQDDPTGPTSGSTRVIRGGSWYGNAHSCRAASRESYPPTPKYRGSGFRVVVVH